MPDTFRIGTYNVENLFDRFDDPYEAGDDPTSRYGTRQKSRAQLYDLGLRIRKSRVDILGIQEVENYGALKDFVQSSVGPKFKVQNGITTQQSNDPRGIDLGLISTLPLGRVISHRFNRFNASSSKRNRRFSRDCLQVEIHKADRSELLVTVFVCHFKSKYSQHDPNSDEYQRDQEKSAAKRTAEANEVVRIIQSKLCPKSDRFAVLGDFNDTPDSKAIAPLVGKSNTLGLVSAATLINQPQNTSTKSRGPRDTHCWQRVDKATGRKLVTWSQIDYILLSPALFALCSSKARVMNTPVKQGSDHYLFWVEFEMP